MIINYDEKEDILFIKFTEDPVLKDVSYDWNVNIGYTSGGIGQITILDAANYGLMPIQLNSTLQNMVYEQCFKYNQA